LGSEQAVQALLYVTSLLEGHGVVTQRIPVSLLAQTGTYSFVHILGLGDLQGTEKPNARGSCFCVTFDVAFVLAPQPETKKLSRSTV